MYGSDEIATTGLDKVRANGEVFTPFVIVDQMNALVPEKAWKDSGYCFLEPTSGNGQFLVKIFEKRIASGISIEDSLNTLIGMEINEETLLSSHFRIFERCVAQMEVEGMKKGNKEWFERAVGIVAIVRNNVFEVKDSIEYINNELEGRPFFAIDPTGHGQVLSESKREKEIIKIKQAFNSRKQGKKDTKMGKYGYKSLAPFFKVGK